MNASRLPKGIMGCIGATILLVANGAGAQDAATAVWIDVPAASTAPWDRRDMERARPAPLLEITDGDPRSLAEAATPTGPMSLRPAMLPRREQHATDLSPPAPFRSLLSNLVPTLDPGYNYPPPFTRFENFPTSTVATYKVFPYVTVGRLFFKQNGAAFTCSAAAIGNYAIWTAGHCLHTGGPGGSWSTDVVFVPAYRRQGANNSATQPFGQWTSAILISNTGWTNNSDFRFDWGGVVLNARSGKKLSDVVGALGFSANVPFGAQTGQWAQIGYPSAPPFTGFRQIICQSSAAYRDFRFAEPRPVGVGCDMTPGSSGGPWILGFGPDGSSNFLNGNVSYRRTGFPLEMYSPYFDGGPLAIRDCLVAATPGAIACP